MKESQELLQEGDSRNSSSSSVPNDQVEGYELRDIGIIVEAGPSGINADAPPLVLDPPTVPASIQAVQIKAMKSKAVEQIQAMLRKRRTKNKEDWKKNMQFVVVIVLALVGLLFTTIGKLIFSYSSPSTPSLIRSHLQNASLFAPAPLAAFFLFNIICRCTIASQIFRQDSIQYTGLFLAVSSLVSMSFTVPFDS